MDTLLRGAADRGLAGVQLIISDACLGLIEAAGELFPDAQWQRCVVHFYRNVFSNVTKGQIPIPQSGVCPMLLEPVTAAPKGPGNRLSDVAEVSNGAVSQPGSEFNRR